MLFGALGVLRCQENLSNVINLRCRVTVGSRRNRACKKPTQKYCLTPFWGLLTVKDRTPFPPTHSLEEIILLKSMFPDAIDCIVAEHNGEAVAGVVYFETANTTHIFVQFDQTRIVKAEI